jgi:hypothetical protein
VESSGACKRASQEAGQDNGDLVIQP